MPYRPVKCPISSHTFCYDYCDKCGCCDTNHKSSCKCSDPKCQCNFFKGPVKKA